MNSGVYLALLPDDEGMIKDLDADRRVISFVRDLESLPNQSDSLFNIHQTHSGHPILKEGAASQLSHRSNKEYIRRGNVLSDRDAYPLIESPPDDDGTGATSLLFEIFTKD